MRSARITSETRPAPHPIPAVHGMREGHGPAPAVPVGDHVSREQVDEALGVTPLGGREEPLREVLPPRARSLEARLLRLDLPARAHDELPAVLRALADDGRDLVVAVVEHLAKEEDRPLHRSEGLQENQEGQ